MSRNRQPVKGLNKSVAEIAADAAAERARKAASKAALKAQRARDAAIPSTSTSSVAAPAGPTDAERAARKTAEHAAYLEALAVDARALNPDATDDEVAAYVAEQIKPAAGTDKPRYTGPMLALRTASVHYVKGANGNPHTVDNLAFALEALDRATVCRVLMAAMKIERNPYAHLNPGQQSMNLRNKARGQFKAGTLTMVEVNAAISAAKA